MLQDGVLVFPNISLHHPQIEQQAYSKARARDELNLIDNPYSPGGQKEGIDPHTGKPKNNNYNNKKRGFDGRQNGNQQNQSDSYRRDSYRNQQRRNKTNSYNSRGSADRSPRDDHQDSGWNNQNRSQDQGSQA
ncbi:hypothetical protein PCANC_15480 [Puccinia coronata f. sp. avenae]|uniref:Uncharacterized protein n=1 Tax=Puccinia coronata f. sp. avenae TaxID=200324 RepID=A0A2N5VFA7_9BASI|nr:hypothetical protein PCANC_15480 [Puccinia coronata f. sp. avenae]